MLLLAGGYAPTPERTARLHANTFVEAAAVFGAEQKGAEKGTEPYFAGTK